MTYCVNGADGVRQVQRSLDGPVASEQERAHAQPELDRNGPEGPAQSVALHPVRHQHHLPDRLAESRVVQLVVGRGPQRHGLADEADGFVTGPVAIADIAARSEG